MGKKLRGRLYGVYARVECFRSANSSELNRRVHAAQARFALFSYLAMHSRDRVENTEKLFRKSARGRRAPLAP